MDHRTKFYSSVVFSWKIVGPSSIIVPCFRGKVVFFIARSYFSGIFRIFRGLFELDLHL